MKTDFLFSSGSDSRKLDVASLILRLAAGGALMYSHGLAKLQKLLSEEVIQFVNPFGLGETATFNIVIFAEFFCATLVILGLLTRWALIPLLINMSFIVLVIHSADPFAVKEMPVLYLAMFLGIMLLGPGKYSLDRLIKKRHSTLVS